MSLVFVIGFPRSSALGIADQLARYLHHPNIIVEGHLHIAAAFNGIDLSLCDSPLGFYDGRESLLRSILKLHSMPDNLDTRNSITKYYFSDASHRLSVDRFVHLVKHKQPLFVDPAFSHSLNPTLLKNASLLRLDPRLVVIWRNPIHFCKDMMAGVYAFDSCLQWILAKDGYSFPLDLLQIWLEIVETIFDEVIGSPSFLGKTFLYHYESFSPKLFPPLARSLSLSCLTSLKPSVIKYAKTLFNDCPYSGDPSYSLDREYDQSLDISLQDLSRFSTDSNLVSKVAQQAEKIGYSLID